MVPIIHNDSSLRNTRSQNFSNIIEIIYTRRQTLFQDLFPIKSLCHVSTLYVTFCIKLDNLFFVCINFLAWTDSQSPDSCGEPLTHRQDFKFWLCFRERCQTGHATQTAPAWTWPPAPSSPRKNPMSLKVWDLRVRDNYKIKYDQFSMTRMAAMIPRSIWPM